MASKNNVINMVKDLNMGESIDIDRTVYKATYVRSAISRYSADCYPDVKKFSVNLAGPYLHVTRVL